MPDSLSQSLFSWHSFYLLAGGASATLVGLMFVAISLGSPHFTGQHIAALRAFVSPTLIHFVYVLVTSSVVLIPTLTSLVLGILLLVVGLISLGLTVSTVSFMHYQYRQGRIDMTDWVWYFLIPSASYLLYVGSGVGLLTGVNEAIDGLAWASVLLLIVGIRNAWDLVIFYTLRKPEPTPRERP